MKSQNKNYKTMKRKYKVPLMILSLIFLFSCGGYETRVINTIHQDGSITRIVSIVDWCQKSYSVNILVILTLDKYIKMLIKPELKNAYYCKLKTKGKKSRSILIHEKAMDRFKLAEKIFKKECGKNNLNKEGQQFIQIVEKKINKTEKKYIKLIQSLEPDECEKGIQWLFNIEQEIIKELLI